MFLNQKNKKGFTLIELLVTIIITGILSGISISMYNSYVANAHEAKMIQELSSAIRRSKEQRIFYQSGEVSEAALMEIEFDIIKKSVILIREKVGKTLREITGNRCSECICRGQNFGDTSLSSNAQQCIDNWKAVINILEGENNLDINYLAKDPWGSPYLMDENELEFNTSDCREDIIYSAGPNKEREFSSNRGGLELQGDDQGVFVPVFTTECS